VMTLGFWSITVTLVFMTGAIAGHLRKMTTIIVDIRSILERMDRDRPQSAPAPSVSRSEPAEAL
jgi:hypothetical protein